jgi:hypothetical protein
MAGLLNQGGIYKIFLDNTKYGGKVELMVAILYIK